MYNVCLIYCIVGMFAKASTTVLQKKIVRFYITRHAHRKVFTRCILHIPHTYTPAHPYLPHIYPHIHHIPLSPTHIHTHTPLSPTHIHTHTPIFTSPFLTSHPSPPMHRPQHMPYHHSQAYQQPPINPPYGQYSNYPLPRSGQIKKEPIDFDVECK